MKAFGKFGAWIKKSKREADMAEELRLHLEQRTREHLVDGLSPEEAHFAAQRQFGNVTQIQELAREQQTWTWLENLFQDLHYCVRQLCKSPGFASVAILTLGLGIGVNTTIFTLVNALNYSPLPFPYPKQVVQLYTQNKKDPEKYRLFSYSLYRELSEQRGLFTGIMAHQNAFVGVGDGAYARRILASVISANYFDVLQVKLLRGRSFSAAEEAPRNDSSVVIASYLFWKKTGLDPALLGSTIRVNERLYTVVGITPESFSGTTALFGPELYFPLGEFDALINNSKRLAKPTLERANAFELILVGRLQPEISMPTAQASLGAFAANLEQAYPDSQKDQNIIIAPLPRDSTSDSPQSKHSKLSTIGLLLHCMAGIVLLVASLNLANLLLARSAARQKEFAIRLALGGSRGRLVRQLLTEGLVLSLAGGLFGLLLAIWSSAFFARSVASIVPESLFFSGTMNPVVLTATFGFSVLSALLFALWPALKFTRSDVVTYLKEQAGETTTAGRGWRPRHPLIVAQIAFSLGLLTCSGLFLRGAFKANNADLGLEADNTLIIETDAGLAGYDDTQSLQLYRNVSEKLAALPNVRSASVASFVPFGFSSDGRSVRRAGVSSAPDGKPSTAADGLAFDARWNSVGASYFETLGLPLLRGRPFTSAEASTRGSPAVAIIDEVLAKKLWPENDALGQFVQYDDDKAGAHTIEVIGIVPAVRTSLFKKVGSAIYVPYAQGFRGPVNFHIRTRSNTTLSALALIDTVRREFRDTAPGVSIFNFRTFREHLAASGDLWIVRMGATLFALFGGLALVLSVIGLYGVKAYSIARRTREIGIRIALGAESKKVLLMILREAFMTVLLGMGIGLLFALALGRLCAGLLYQISPVDPFAFTFASLVLVITAMLASFLPAWRAARIDPLVALRTE